MLEEKFLRSLHLNKLQPSLKSIILSIFLTHLSLAMQLIAHSHKRVVPLQSSVERYPLIVQRGFETLSNQELHSQ